MLPVLQAAMQRWRGRLGFYLTSLRSTIVLSAGMPRSGSTWLFNTARLLLRGATPAGGLSSGWLGDWPSLRAGRTILLKVHDFEPRLARSAAVVVYSYRDVRDVLASSKRKFGTAPTPEQARQLLNHDRRWRQVADLTMRYESMLADPEAIVTDLAAVLRVGACDAAAVVAEVERLSHDTQRMGEAAYDSETLLHPGHITDGRYGSWEGWLAPGLVAQLEEECGEWLSRNGYPLSCPARERGPVCA